MGPVLEIGHKPVFLRVLVDVDDQILEIMAIIDRFAAKRVLKEASGSLVGFVDRLGVGIEEV